MPPFGTDRVWGYLNFSASSALPSLPGGSERGFQRHVSDWAESDEMKCARGFRFGIGKTHGECHRAQQQHHGIDQPSAVDLHLEETDTRALNLWAVRAPPTPRARGALVIPARLESKRCGHGERVAEEGRVPGLCLSEEKDQAGTGMTVS